jgi:hypothetical protein
VDVTNAVARSPSLACASSAGAPERLASLAAWMVPFVAALLRTSSHAQWRGDLAAARDLALVPVGLRGGVSTALTQLVALAPLGSTTFRSALVSVIALSVAGAVLQRLALAALRSFDAPGAPSRWAAPWLATLASLTATMSPLLQEEATAGGGVIVSVALVLGVLGVLLAAPDAALRPAPRRIVVAGFLCGAALAENPTAGAAALVLVAAVLAGARHAQSAAILPWRVVGKACLALGSGAAFFLLPGVLRAVAPNAALPIGSLGLPDPRRLPDAPDVSMRPDLVAAFVDEIGWLPLGLAALGILALGSQRRGRALALVPMAWIGLDVALRAALGPREDLVAARVLAIAGVACLSTAGLFAATKWLGRSSVPFARPASALLVAFHATLVALVAEIADERANRDAQRGAVAFTDRALEELPPSAAVVTESGPVTWRLVVAQLVEGRRRDVLVVPKGLVDRGWMAATLLTREPALEPAVRTIALTGTTDERALSSVADKRPLHLEADRSWDDAVLLHLLVQGPWLRFRSDPPSRADRRASLERTLFARSERDRKAASDPVSRFVAGCTARTHAKVLLRQGEVEGASDVLADLGEVPVGLGVAQGGSLDVLFAGAVARRPRLPPPRDRAHTSRRGASSTSGRRR